MPPFVLNVIVTLVAIGLGIAVAWLRKRRN